MSKRGQQPAASGAAILILIVTAILVLYILFLPPQDRAELLGEENESRSDDDETRSGFNKTLLKETSVGRLDYLRFDEREHDIPSFRVYSETSGTVIASTGSLYVSRSLGNQQEHNMTFGLNERLTSKTKLSFNVKQSKGRLMILLNGFQIFDGILNTGSPLPLDLPNNLLKSSNVLTFKVSSPGVAFWRTNQYLLENVEVTGDVLDVSHSTSRQFFFVTDEEQLNLESIKLKFLPQCDVRDVGPLIIYLNGQEVYSGVGDCGVFNTISMDPDLVFEDKNELEFVVAEGSYLIDRVSVKTELDELLFPVYFFDVDEDLFHDDRFGLPVFDEDFNVTLRIRFVNDEDKRMEFVINGHRRGINTDEFIYEERIEDFVLPETNSLEIIPKSEGIDIAELRVLLDEND